MSDSAPKKSAKINNPGTGTVFDVKRPGRIPIQTTSRPLIASNKLVVRDPVTTGKPASTVPVLQIKQKVTIKPVESIKPVPATPAATTAASPELAVVAAELAATSVPVKSEPAVDVSVSKIEESPKTPIGDLKDEATLKDEKPSEEAPKDFVPGFGAPVLPPDPSIAAQAPLSPEMKKQIEVAAQEIVPTKEPDGVVVSGDHGPLNFAKIFLWFVAVIVLVVVAGDVLLDAGTITTSVAIPHTHFIK
jgi:hypothetical protein